MGRITRLDVEEMVERIDSGVAVDLSFRCHGSGTNKYRLVNDETGEAYGPWCSGSSEFMKFLQGFHERRKVE